MPITRIGAILGISYELSFHSMTSLTVFFKSIYNCVRQFRYLAPVVVWLLVLVTPAVPVQAQELFPSIFPTINITRANFYDIMLSIAGLAIFVLPGIALLFLIFGAFKFVTGEKDKGWEIIKNTFFGLVIAGGSFLIIGAVTGVLNALYSGDLISFG